MVAYIAPSLPNVAQESTLQEILKVLGGSVQTGTWDNSGGAFAASRAIGASSASSKALVFLITAVSTAGASLWWQMFDSLAVPADGATPSILPVPLIVNTVITVNLTGDAAFPITNGISWAISSAQATKTLSATTAWVNTLFQAGTP